MRSFYREIHSCIVIVEWHIHIILLHSLFFRMFENHASGCFKKCNHELTVVILIIELLNDKIFEKKELNRVQ